MTITQVVRVLATGLLLSLVACTSEPEAPAAPSQATENLDFQIEITDGQRKKIADAALETYEAAVAACKACDQKCLQALSAAVSRGNEEAIAIATTTGEYSGKAGEAEASAKRLTELGAIAERCSEGEA